MAFSVLGQMCGWQLKLFDFSSTRHPERFTDVFRNKALCLYVKGARSSDFGFLGSKVHKNGRFPVVDADEPPCKI